MAAPVNRCRSVHWRQQTQYLSYLHGGSPHFPLNKQDAAQIVQAMQATIRAEWDATCNEAGLSEVDRNLFWGRMFFSPFVFEDN